MSPLLGVIIGALLAGSIQFIIEGYKSRQSDKKSKMRVYSDLKGYKRSLLQYMHSYFLALIDSRGGLVYAGAIKSIDFDEIEALLVAGKREEATRLAQESLDSAFNESPDKKESLRIRRNEEKLQLQVGESGEKFSKIITQIAVLFSDAKIDGLIKQIETAEEDLDKLDKSIAKLFTDITDEIEKGPKSLSSNKKRDAWYEEKKEKLKEAMKSDFDTKIKNLDLKTDDLLNHLNNCIKNWHWWNFW